MRIVRSHIQMMPSKATRAQIQRMVLACWCGCNGSRAAGRSMTTTGGSTLHTCPSHSDGSYGLFSSRSVESFELRLPARSSRTAMSPTAAVR